MPTPNRMPPAWGAILALGIAVVSMSPATATGGPPAAPAARPAMLRLSLEQAIALARGQSPSALAAIHRYRASYWQYVTFKADNRPSLDL